MRQPRPVSPTGIALCLFAASGCGTDSSALPEWSPKDHQPPPATAGTDRAAPNTAPDPQATSRTLYSALCAQCHGSDGRGGGPGSPPGAILPNFADPEVQAQASEELWVRTIREGRGLMPAFGDRLTPKTIAELIQVLRGFAPKPADAPPAAPLGTEAPSEGPAPAAKPGGAPG